MYLYQTSTKLRLEVSSKFRVNFELEILIVDTFYSGSTSDHSCSFDSWPST